LAALRCFPPALLPKGGSGSAELHALKSAERSGGLPYLRGVASSGAELRARRWVVELEALEGRGSLREEQLAFTGWLRRRRRNTGKPLNGMPGAFEPDRALRVSSRL
jgi:hypothetical protein